MPQARQRRRERGKPASVAYTLPELATHWKLSWSELVDRLCDPDTRVPIFADTTILAGDRDCYGRLRKFADGKLLRFTGRERKFVLDPAGNKWPDDLVTTGKTRQPDLERVREILTGRPEEEVILLPLAGTGELFCASRAVWRSAFRVKVCDVEGYDNRPVQEAQDRARRAKGGPLAAAKVHEEHVETKVKPYREEYRTRLKAGEKSTNIIDDIARNYDKDGWAKNPEWARKRMRDMIKPRQQGKT